MRDAEAFDKPGGLDNSEQSASLSNERQRAGHRHAKAEQSQRVFQYGGSSSSIRRRSTVS